MARTEWWKKEIEPAQGDQPPKVSFASLEIADDNTVRISYELFARVMQVEGFQKVGETDGA